MNYNLEQRALIDGELTQRSIDFMQRAGEGEQPFFLYLPYTADALPGHPAPGVSPARPAMAALPMSWPRSTQYNGMLLDAVDELGIRDNTHLHFHCRQR